MLYSKKVSRQNTVQIEKLTFQYEANQDYSVPIVIIGELNKEYTYCRAFKSMDEFQSLRCSNGKIKLQYFLAPPEPFKWLLTGSTVGPYDFLKTIRPYNNAFFWSK